MAMLSFSEVKYDLNTLSLLYLDFIAGKEYDLSMAVDVATLRESCILFLEKTKNGGRNGGPLLDLHADETTATSPGGREFASMVPLRL